MALEEMAISSGWFPSMKNGRMRWPPVSINIMAETEITAPAAIRIFSSLNILPYLAAPKL